MNYLTQRQEQLLNTDFGADMEKRAHEIVEMEKVASDCITYGYELAMQKIAELEEKAAKGEDEKEEEKEEEKTAAAMGQIILDSYWSTLMEKGAEFYGDSDIYIDKMAAGVDPTIMDKIKHVAGHGISPKKTWGAMKDVVSNPTFGGKMKSLGKASVMPLAVSGLAYGGKKIYDKVKKKPVAEEPQY